MRKGWELLNVGGRMAIISFHSVEDREVKFFFKNKSKNEEGKLINKKPIIPTDEEVRENPRSRSAKLRVIEKIK
jgi:16S rRNA (cytosine1402-N4)-methyltransferase